MMKPIKVPQPNLANIKIRTSHQQPLIRPSGTFSPFPGRREKEEGSLRAKQELAGFTLIEVLLALSVIAIALTALLKATAQNVSNTQRIKEKTISHWIAMQGVSMIQLGLLHVNPSQDVTKVTTMLGQRWYWRVKISQTAIKSLQQITITVSKNQAGPFSDPLIAFRYQK